MKRAHPEHDLHKAVAQYLRVALRPPVFWTSIDHGAGKMGIASASSAKARGVKAGLPDILVFAPARVDDESIVFAIELKAGKGTVSEDQRTILDSLSLAGATCRVARSIEEVRDLLADNGIPLFANVAR